MGTDSVWLCVVVAEFKVVEGSKGCDISKISTGLRTLMLINFVFYR